MRKLIHGIGRLAQSVILFTAGLVGGGLIFTLANAAVVLA